VTSRLAAIFGNFSTLFVWNTVVRIYLTCNCLVRNGVARFESVMELRNYLEHLGTMEGANRDEKGKYIKFMTGGSLMIMNPLFFSRP